MISRNHDISKRTVYPRVSGYWLEGRDDIPVICVNFEVPRKIAFPRECLVAIHVFADERASLHIETGTDMVVIVDELFVEDFGGCGRE